MKAKNGISTYATAKGTRFKVRYRKPDGSAGAKAGFMTRGAAKAFQLQLEVGRAEGNFVDPARGKITIEALALEWLAAREEDKKKTKPSTLSRVRGIIHNRIIPDLGSFRVGDLNKGDVNAWVRKLDGEPETIRKTVSVLRGILTFAEDDQRIHRSPARNLVLPTIPTKQKRSLTDRQVIDLMKAVDDTNDGAAHGYGTLVGVLGFTGLRWSELAGLRIGDLDLRNRKMLISHTVVQVDGKLVEGVPKNYAERTIPIPEVIIHDLAAHVARRETELAADARQLRSQLRALGEKETELALVRKNGAARRQRLEEVQARHAMLTERRSGLVRDRDQRVEDGLPTEPVDSRIERVDVSLRNLPSIDRLQLMVDKVPGRIAELERQISKKARQTEIIREHLAVINQKPVFVGVRTRSWLRNPVFRAGWLTPAVKLMDERARAAAEEADERLPKPVGDIEPHELRHSFASIAVSRGAKIKALQRTLGHQKASVTLDVYAELFDSDLDDVARLIDAGLRPLFEDTDIRASVIPVSEMCPIEVDDLFADVP
ncbi:tyrosine-type recombinase/integrase [Microbacterium sp.]|uniref:tyrosine-type recombinase/integrase n=1 Tax=Microbacterium sp. TaxID=51671 RepID=UPI0039E4BF12